MMTSVSVGCCRSMRRSTSRKRSRGSSTTGMRTVVPVVCASVHGRYRRDSTVFTAHDSQTRVAAMENR
jgi:hypothetical protein